VQWPAPFTDDGSVPVFWTEVEDGHYVRIARDHGRPVGREVE
jgi:hypothetical protein